MGCSTLNVQRCGDGDGDRFYNSFNVVETAEITIIIQEFYNFMPTGMYVIWHQAILYYQVFGNIFRIPVSFSYDTIVRSASAVSCSQYIFILLVPSSGPMCIFLLFTFLFSISLPGRNSGPRPLCRLFSSLPATARAFVFIAIIIYQFFSSLTRVESRLPML